MQQVKARSEAKRDLVLSTLQGIAEKIEDPAPRGMQAQRFRGCPSARARSSAQRAQPRVAWSREG